MSDIKKQKAKMEEEQRRKEEADRLAAEKAAQDEEERLEAEARHEAFVKSHRASLELVNAFGSYTGARLNALTNGFVPYKNKPVLDADGLPLVKLVEGGADPTAPDELVQNHVLFIDDTQGIFEKLSTKEHPEALSDENTFGFNRKEAVRLEQGRPTDFTGMVLVYPVGRHIAFRHVQSNRMRFI
jgi:hypothetical protein